MISIHAPRTGSDGQISEKAFLGIDFNPRSPYGERRVLDKELERQTEFQSTLPVRGATR